MQHQHCRIGIDVGGTFTDFVFADRITGRLVRYKEPSVPADPSLSVERGLPPLIERAGVAPSEIELVVHGTTLALNASHCSHTARFSSGYSMRLRNTCNR